ncbi:putative signal transduction protein with CBS domains [Methanocaldococcus vulcanius M7]|uniref:Signal transduction protein with CBS domains n=1 Tax=Methanocaldococcus vulcanius (strain ATCC 700851 / DSM 12094 / M7) TaxID=579137 RepID=C9RGM8_METVM|nr:CBS domain-containing protein [Methanocaldococcus vulcanius]ACX72730.1 putative signal transduction protein with CBS domains [Methanocaldococcus vulcanius M7]
MKVIKIAENKKIITVYPTTTIRNALKTMNENRYRRLPVVNAGNNKVVGIITSMDIVDFMGGGSKYNLIREKHGRNLLSAINEPVREIMEENVITLKENSEIDDAIETFLNKNVGGVPIVNDENQLISLITERDIIRSLIDKIDENAVIDDYITRDVIVATPGERLKDVARTMVRNGFRRLPVVSEERLVGIITSTDFIKLLGSDWAFNHLKTGNVREITNVRMEEIMKKDVITAKEGNKLKDIAKTMIDNDIGALPVIDENNRVVGIITEKDILKYFEDYFSKR